MTLFTQNGKNDSEFHFGNIMLGWFASPRFERRFLDNAIKSSSRIWEPWRKTAFYNLLQLIQLFSESFGHPSLCFIHVIKPDHPYFEHTKYEPDTSRHAREKWGVKIVLDFRTPCTSNRVIAADQINLNLNNFHAWISYQLVAAGGGESCHLPISM